MQKIKINGIELLIISNATRLRHDIGDDDLLPLGKNKFGVERYLYTCGKRMDDFIKVIGLNPDKVDYASPKECWRKNDMCYYDYNTETYGAPLYHSEIIAKLKEVVRKELGID